MFPQARLHPERQGHGGGRLAVVGIEAGHPDPGAYIGRHQVVREGQGPGEVQGIHRQPVRLIRGDGGGLMAVEQLYHAGIIHLPADEEAPVARALPLQGAYVGRGGGFIHRLEVDGRAITQERGQLPARRGRLGRPARQRQAQSQQHHRRSRHALLPSCMDCVKSISEPVPSDPGWWLYRPILATRPRSLPSLSIKTCAGSHYSSGINLCHVS